jgi:hypothetical protein
MSFNFKHTPNIILPDIKKEKKPETQNVFQQFSELLRRSFTNIYDDLDMLSGHMPVTVYGDTLTLTKGGVYIATITGIKTWTLPSISKSEHRFFFIKNRGSAELTVARAGADEIYTTSAVTSVAVAAGVNILLINDKTYFVQIL